MQKGDGQAIIASDDGILLSVRLVGFIPYDERGRLLSPVGRGVVGAPATQYPPGVAAALAVDSYPTVFSIGKFYEYLFLGGEGKDGEFVIDIAVEIVGIGVYPELQCYNAGSDGTLRNGG